MKTAEDFRSDFGETEESFRACVRQTLTVLECKEEEPVKKKINMGLVLAIAIMLLTATAVAEEQWGLLNFLRSQGKEATEDQLLSMNVNTASHPDITYRLVDAVMTEALYEDGTLYLAVTLTPTKENTLVVPCPDAMVNWQTLKKTNPNELHLETMSIRACMQNDAYEDVSVMEYAKSRGFDHVVMMDYYYANVQSTHTFWTKDQFIGLQHAAYNHLEDGSLQMILQVGYEPNLAFSDENRRETADVSVHVYSYDLAHEGQWRWQYGSTASTWSTFELPADRVHLRSIPEDAHNIVGYRGAIEYISIAPYDDEYMAITIQMNMNDGTNESTWMTGPDWVILDAEGNRLCKVDGSKFMGVTGMPDENGNRFTTEHGLFPAEHMPEGNQITIQAENWRNYNIVYDRYTYTLTNDQAAE